MTESLLRATGLEHAFGEPTRNAGAMNAHNSLTVNHLEIRAGEMVGLLGPNGAGKSTLLRLLGALQPPDRGIVEFCGENVESLSLPVRARRVAWVPQRAETPFEWTVREMVSTGRYARSGFGLRDSASDGEIVDAALDRVGLWDLRDRRVDRLSGGEWQRALLARSLAQEPRVLLLDEPVANLDLGYQREIYELARSLCRERGWAILTADHHIDLQARFCDRMILLDRGRILAEGTPEEVVRVELLEPVFRTPLRVDRDPATGRPQVRWRFDEAPGKDRRRGGSAPVARRQTSAPRGDGGMGA